MREKLQHEMEDADCDLRDACGEKGAENVGKVVLDQFGKVRDGDGLGDTAKELEDLDHLRDVNGLKSLMEAEEDLDNVVQSEIENEFALPLLGRHWTERHCLSDSGQSVRRGPLRRPETFLHFSTFCIDFDRR
jgi:hypothetical protein